MGKAQYVVSHGKLWGVKTEGNKNCSYVFKRKCDAVAIATKRAKETHSELRIQNRDVRFGACNSYGNDPCPPKDKNI